MDVTSSGHSTEVCLKIPFHGLWTRETKVCINDSPRKSYKHNISGYALAIGETWGVRSGDNVVGDIAVHVGEAEVAASVTIRQLLMIQSK
jgi:hypothetical protein